MDDVAEPRDAFRPDVIETVTDDDVSMTSATSGGRRRRELPKEVTAVRLQILAIQVMAGLHGWLGSSSNGVIVVSSVVDGLGTEPITFQGKPYLGIKDGDLLPLGPANDPSAVFTVYYREGQLPRTLAFSLLVIRSNRGLRDIGSAISGAMADDRYKELSGIVTTAVSAAVPAYGLVLQVAEQSIGLIASYLKVKPDDQLGYYQANYTNRFDDLGVGRHPADTRTFPVDKIMLAYQLDAS
jgi:hypothetical protein